LKIVLFLETYAISLIKLFFLLENRDNVPYWSLSYLTPICFDNFNWSIFFHQPSFEQQNLRISIFASERHNFSTIFFINFVTFKVNQQIMTNLCLSKAKGIVQLPNNFFKKFVCFILDKGFF
jgi:hypothetical protein